MPNIACDCNCNCQRFFRNLPVFMILITAFLAGACRSSQPAHSSPADEPSSPPAYRLVYLIHGDANYLYHTADGHSLRADEQVLDEARRAGRMARSGEVFIFHQQPESRILWLFPRKDRRFLHYRRGTLVRDVRYSPVPPAQGAPFAAEAALFAGHRHPDRSDSLRSVLLYFGHEIPERRRTYHASRPSAPLTTAGFARGVGSFDTRFDLTVLSTCNNGTPSMIRTLTPYSRYILASPQNLHLSHIDTAPLPRLMEQPDHNPAAIADSLAATTYTRLASFLQTAITLSVYDTQQTRSYLRPLAQQYQRHLSDLSAQALLADNGDCARLDFFSVADDTAGVRSWYRPARFGRRDTVGPAYSGWGCKREQ